MENKGEKEKINFGAINIHKQSTWKRQSKIYILRLEATKKFTKF